MPSMVAAHRGCETLWPSPSPLWRSTNSRAATATSAFALFPIDMALKENMPVMLAASTGMRRGEVLAVRWKDIDLDACTLQVAQVVEFVGRKVSLKEPKTERSRRSCPIGLSKN